MPPVIPAATMQKLSNPAPPGQRHEQIVKIACSMYAQGWNSEAIFSHIRPNYGPDVSDKEIRDVIRWAEKKYFGNFTAKKFQYSPATALAGGNWSAFKAKARNQNTIITDVERLLKGFSCADADLFEASPVRLSENYREDCLFVFEVLYFPENRINIVTDFEKTQADNGVIKANPTGFGITKTRNEWIDYCRNNPVPESEAGAWLRINPIHGNGISDNDISDFRFVLLESDILPLEIQFSVFGKLPLPISAILTSGGKSLHAWVKIAAHSVEEYRIKVRELFSFLSPLGFDPLNKNPSRLSRLPGVQRKIGAKSDGIQKLIYLNPSPAQGRSIL